MVFESFAHVPVTEELLWHVWEGEEDPSKGGHRFGLGRELKTEFPEDWDLARVELAINLVLSSPHVVRYRPGPFTIARQVGEVIVEVKIAIKAGEMWIMTAYPVCGTGVVSNQRGLRVTKPLDISVLEA